MKQVEGISEAGFDNLEYLLFCSMVQLSPQDFTFKRKQTVRGRGGIKGQAELETLQMNPRLYQMVGAAINAYENTSTEYGICMNVIADGCVGIQVLAEKSLGRNTYSIDLPPRSRQAVIFKYNPLFKSPRFNSRTSKILLSTDVSQAGDQALLQ